MANSQVKSSRRAPRETGLARQQQREKVLALMAKKPKSKYRAVRCEVDGEKFDSKREMRRWKELKLWERIGRIRGLIRQPRYPLFSICVNPPSLDRVCLGDYVADFEYFYNQGDQWNQITEDAKGVRTPLYRWKKKHFEAQYGRKILET